MPEQEFDPNKAAGDITAYQERCIKSYPALVAALQAHDAYMSEQFFDGPNSKALNPRAAENWRRVRAALREAGITQQEEEKDHAR